MPVPPSDVELVGQALAGSQEAYYALVSRYSTPAVNLAARIVGDRALAEDLAQEAFVRAFERMASYDRSRRFSSWFLQIVHNVTIDQLRRRRIHTVSIDEPDTAGHSRFVVQASNGAPDVQAERSALAAALEQALQTIRPEYRTAVVLRYQEGMSHPEIAEVMSLPVGTVKTYLHRARKELATAMTLRGWALGNPKPQSPNPNPKGPRERAESPSPETSRNGDT